MPNSATPADRSIEKRRIRRHHILGLLRSQGPLSRASIARIAGYNLPTVSSLVDQLVEDGLASEQEAKPTKRGRRPIPVTLETRAAMVMGLEVSRSSTIGLLLDLAGTVLARYEEPTPKFRNHSAQGSWVRDFAVRLCDTALDPLPPLAGIGVALPELIPLPRGDRYIPLALQEGSTAEAVRQKLHGHFGVPILVDCDARMLTVGCMWSGPAQEKKDFCALCLGDRLGLGIVINGAVYQGSHGMGGQIDRLPLGGPEPLEDVLSGVGLTRQAEIAGLGALDALSIAEAARGGNKAASKIIAAFSKRLGLLIALLINMGNPPLLIIGGRLSAAADLYLKDALKEASQYTHPDAYAATQVITNQWQQDSACLGAASAVLQRIFSSAHVQLEEVL